MNHRHALGWTLALFGCLGILAPRPSLAQSFVNGSFETDGWFLGWSQKNATPAGWYLNVNNGYEIGFRNNYSGKAGPTPFGNQFVNLDGDSKMSCKCSGHAYIEQSVGNFNIGKRYRLTFSVASEELARLQEASWISVEIHGPNTNAAKNFPAPYGNVQPFDNWGTYTYDFIANDPTLTFHFQHMEPPQFFDWNGVGLDNVSVAEVCGPPPLGMTAWWPLDENTLPVARDVIGAHNGTQVQPITYLYPNGGWTGSAYDFGSGGGYVRAGTTVGNFGAEFTVDAWVLMRPGRTCTGAVIDKETGKPQTTNMWGYKLYVDSGNHPGCMLGLGGTPVSFTSSTPLPTNGSWHHLAMTARRDLYGLGPNSILTTYYFEFFVDGQWAGANSVSTVSDHVVSIANTGEFRIGQNDPNQSPCPLGAAVDEVELFSRALTDKEVAGLAAIPKCKCHALACNLVQFGFGDIQKHATIRICNDGPVADIPWSISGLPAQGSQCSIDGSVLQFLPSSGVAHVTQGSCVDVDVIVKIPQGAGNAGFTSDAKAACYAVSTASCGGSGIGYGRVIGPTVIDSIVQCVSTPPPCFVTIRGGRGSTLTWSILNTSNVARDVAWSVRECWSPVDSVSADTLVSVLSLNGLPPGTPIPTSTLHLAPNDSVSVSVTASFAQAQVIGAAHAQLLLGAVGNPAPGVASDVNLVSDETCGARWNGWAAVAPDSTPPTARSDGSMIWDAANNRFVLFGGFDGAFRNDVWVFNPDSQATWRHLAPSGTAPAGRRGHSAIYDPVRHRMLVFGGFDGANSLNDVWALDLTAASETWTQLTPTGPAPSQRYSASAIYDVGANRMVVFGGSPHLNDLFFLSLSGTPTWQAPGTSGPAPTGRLGHSAVYDAASGRMIVFGGQSVTGYQNDVSALSLNGSPVWSTIAPSGALPSARAFQYAVLDSATRELDVIGGQGASGTTRDVWTLPLAAATAWIETTPGQDGGPSARVNAFGPGRDVNGFFYLFGGLDSTAATHDLWALPNLRSCSNATSTVSVGTSELVRSGVLAAPNPFHATTAIQFSLSEAQVVSVSIFDVAGRLVRRIDAGRREAGPVRIHWNGLDAHGAPARPGIYLVRVRIGESTQLGRVVRVY